MAINKVKLDKSFKNKLKSGKEFITKFVLFFMPFILTFIDDANMYKGFKLFNNAQKQKENHKMFNTFLKGEHYYCY